MEGAAEWGFGVRQGRRSSIEADGGKEDRALSIATRDAVLAAVTTDAAIGEPATRQAAATLRAQLGEPAELSKGEAALLDELLARLSAT